MKKLFTSWYFWVAIAAIVVAAAWYFKKDEIKQAVTNVTGTAPATPVKDSPNPALQGQG